jgi:hypothetical protein
VAKEKSAVPPAEAPSRPYSRSHPYARPSKREDAAYKETAFPYEQVNRYPTYPQQSFPVLPMLVIIY